MADEVVDAAKGFITRALAGVGKRIDEIEQRIAAIPAGKDAVVDYGKLGEIVTMAVSAAVAALPAPANGKDADPEVVRAIVVGELGPAIAAIPRPENGKDAVVDYTEVDKSVRQAVAEAVGALPPPPPGKDAEVDYRRVEGLVKAAVDAIPRPKDGQDAAPVDFGAIDAAIKHAVATKIEAMPTPKDGASIDSREVATIVDTAVARSLAALPAPKDGESVHPDTVALMVVKEVAKAAEKIALSIPKPKDGEPGRDAIQCEPLPSIDAARCYPRATLACFRGGMVRSFRETDPLAVDGDLVKAGWSVMVQGIAEEVEEISADGRTEKRVTRYTDGSEYERIIKRSVVLDRGVYREGEEYAKGDGATWAGSFWIAQKDTASKPDATDGSWRLSVKKGRDGKDFARAAA